MTQTTKIIMYEIINGTTIIATRISTIQYISVGYKNTTFLLFVVPVHTIVVSFLPPSWLDKVKHTITINNFLHNVFTQITEIYCDYYSNSSIFQSFGVQCHMGTFSFLKRLPRATNNRLSVPVLCPSSVIGQGLQRR